MSIKETTREINLINIEHTLELAYRKHHLNDENVGWDELSEELRDSLCELKGDEKFQRWLKDQSI